MSGRGRGGRGGRGGGPPQQGGGPPQRGGRGGGQPRGPARGGGPAGPAGAAPRAGLPAQHVQTVGVKRSGFGTLGQQVTVLTNHFPVDIPNSLIYHYDAITPSEQTLPLKLNMELIKHLQEVIAPQVFTPRGVYDGRKNLFSVHEYPFTEGSMTFDVTLPDQPSTVQYARPKSGPKGGPKVYKVKLTKVAVINSEVTKRFLDGQQSHDNVVLTAITALNVVVRHEPTSKYPFNVRSFFTNKETKAIGSGMVLWRGWFQSVRPGIGRMFMNIDISTAAMYRGGSLIELILDFLGRKSTDPNILAPSRGFPDRERLRVQRFIQGVKVLVMKSGRVKTVKGLIREAANARSFRPGGDGAPITIAKYYKDTYNLTLKYPDLPCVELHGRGALIPLELCDVPEGQIMRKQVPSERTKDVVEFATKQPKERLRSIVAGLGVLQYGQSEYVRQFGLHVHGEPLPLNARVLPPPTLMYGAKSRVRQIMPRDGAWNMRDKTFHRAATISTWAIIVYERRINEGHTREIVSGFIQACESTGMTVQNKEPVIAWENAQGNVLDHVKKVGGQCRQRYNALPNLMVFILPDAATDLYTSIKHVCDVILGVASQCLKSQKCSRANQQYFANVCLKMNVKLGGINVIPDARSVPALTDPRNPTIVMGADVIHPAAHSEGRPSFTALVANVDSDSAKYVATSRVQTSRQEMIDDLQSMAKYLLGRFMSYRQQVEKHSNPAPKRIIFYRDGVSEGQFKQVLELELPLLKAACDELKIKPSITIIVVGKRHHVRFFPSSDAEADRSGNCRAGTVVDTDIAHPTDLDWYLQSHAGLLGTSRPAHYNVLYDENGFTVDHLQSLSFALCHVYARSTRSVSIPAPVYYADIVCSRAKNHYSPDSNLDLSDTQTIEGSQAENQLDLYKAGFRPINPALADKMYFS